MFVTSHEQVQSADDVFSVDNKAMYSILFEFLGQLNADVTKPAMPLVPLGLLHLFILPNITKGSIKQTHITLTKHHSCQTSHQRSTIRAIHSINSSAHGHFGEVKFAKAAFLSA